MENSMAVLAETFGAETVLSAVIVCVVTMLIKKIKPNLSPKAEVGVRFVVSLITRLLFLLITKGEFLGWVQGATSVCGVSMVVCTLFTKTGKKEKVKEEISLFLPDLDEQKLNAVLGEEEMSEVPIEVASAKPNPSERPTDGV